MAVCTSNVGLVLFIIVFVSSLVVSLAMDVELSLRFRGEVVVLWMGTVAISIVVR
jgi:hypothetical protein